MVHAFDACARFLCASTDASRVQVVRLIPHDIIGSIMFHTSSTRCSFSTIAQSAVGGLVAGVGF